MGVVVKGRFRNVKRQRRSGAKWRFTRQPLCEHQKAEAELAFWGNRLQEQGRLSNDHYEYFYTTYFGLDTEFFVGKKS
jgi:hypothetical protein